MKNTLKDWANALHAYVAFPKRWSDEDSASYLHVFFGKPVMGEDGDWTKDPDTGTGWLLNSFYIERSMSKEMRSIPVEDSLTGPDDEYKTTEEYCEKTYTTNRIDPQTIANLMNMYVVKLANGDLFMYKNKPSLVECFEKSDPPLPDQDFESFNWNNEDMWNEDRNIQDDTFKRDMWNENRNIFHILKTPMELNWFAPGYVNNVPYQFPIDKRDYYHIPYTEFIFEPEK